MAIGDLRAACAALGSRSSPITDSELASLRRRVDAAVDTTKASGIPCERVVLAIKTMALDTGLLANDVSILERLADWAVKRYYANGYPLW